MLTPEESTLLLDMNVRLRKLHVRKATALQCGNQARSDELQAKIDELTDGCDKVMDAADASE
jgi:hypothetical protein